MGFRTGAYAKVWDVKPKSDWATDLRVSVSRKDKETGEFKQTFSGFVTARGTAVAQRALKLKAGDRIKLGDVDVETFYAEKTKTVYTNFIVYSFDLADGASPSNDGHPDTAAPKADAAVDEGEPSEDLPF